MHEALVVEPLGTCREDGASHAILVAGVGFLEAAPSFRLSPEPSSYGLLVNLRPHPEEPLSGVSKPHPEEGRRPVSKEDPERAGDALILRDATLLRMRA
jgi:hypothetical protein